MNDQIMIPYVIPSRGEAISKYCKHYFSFLVLLLFLLLFISIHQGLTVHTALIVLIIFVNYILMFHDI